MKNKGLLIGGLVIAIIAGLVLYGYFTQSTSTISSNNRNFNIEDTAAVTKVFIADMFNNQVELSREPNGEWMVNKEYKAYKNTINTLLETLHLITIKAPVSKSKYDMVVRYMSATGTKVEVYMNNGDVPEKIFYLGPSNQTHTGTYMMLENSTTPYLMHIEGFYGFLNPRFSPYANEWRDKLIVDLLPTDIAKIQIAHSDSPEEDFILTRNEMGQIAITNGVGLPLADMDTTYAFDYLERFQNLNFESWEETKTPMFIDSVRKSTPTEIYQITDIAGNITKIATYPKPLSQSVEMDGEIITQDQDRMYGVINDNEFVVMQYFIFDPLNQKLNMFKKQ